MTFETDFNYVKGILGVPKPVKIRQKTIHTQIGGSAVTYRVGLRSGARGRYIKPQHSTMTIIEMFNTFWIEQNTGYRTPCYLWQGYLTPDGYGKFKDMHAHRWIYIHEYPSMDLSLVVDHLCTVHHCVRLDHLEAVTSGENVKRGFERRKGMPRKYASSPDLTYYELRTERSREQGLTTVTCINGHEVQPDWTECRPCHAEQEERRRLRHKEEGITYYDISLFRGKEQGLDYAVCIVGHKVWDGWARCLRCDSMRSKKKQQAYGVKPSKEMKEKGYTYYDLCVFRSEVYELDKVVCAHGNHEVQPHWKACMGCKYHVP